MGRDLKSFTAETGGLRENARIEGGVGQARQKLVWELVAFVFPVSSIRAFLRDPPVSAESRFRVSPTSGISSRSPQQRDADCAETRGLSWDR
jgi:hypothetical protein